MSENKKTFDFKRFLKIFSKNKRVFEETRLNLLSNDSSFDFKEAYNTLASNIIHLSLDDGCKKIAVTSSNYGEGKSSVAINLAIALASNLIDKRILLVDADLRSSHIEEFLGDIVTEHGNNQGISDYLLGSTEICNIKKTNIVNLDVVSAGSSVINPVGLLNSNKMNDLLLSLENDFDYVIIDTPPVSVVSDAVLLAEKVSGYIISTKAGFSTVPMLDSASEALASVGANVFGVVLTENKK